MGMGSNTLAALVTRGCSEIAKLAKVMGAKPFTLAGTSRYYHIYVITN